MFRIRRLLALIAFCVLTSCATLPEERLCPDTYALPPDSGFFPIKLGEIDRSECGQECSGFITLNRGEVALRWRLAFADIAQKSIDVQLPMARRCVRDVTDRTAPQCGRPWCSGAASD